MPEPALRDQHRAYRMFDLPATSFKREALIDLADEQVRQEIPDTSGLPAGYTYFGQFIDHDITPPSHPPDPRMRPTTTASLDLKSLYGSGLDDPTVAINRRSGKFESQYTNLNLIYDLPRGAGSLVARIPESRNDENFIVAQLHVLFMNLHNKLVDAHAGSFNPFLAAQEEMRFLYQRVIWNDYLKRILDEDVYSVLHGPPGFRFLLRSTCGEEPQVPVEFAGAVFRFGHSIVRRRYPLNGSHTAVDLPMLMRLTGPGRLAGLANVRDFRIDWRFFFDLTAFGKGPFERARSFSTSVLAETAAVGKEAPEPLSLAQRDLLRGAELRLPDAQSIIAHLRHRHRNYALTMRLRAVKPAQLRTHKIGEVLATWGFDAKTPLWTYVLLEPWFRPGSQRGQRLGKLGSIIVGEVFRSLLISSRPSLCFDANVAGRSMLLKASGITVDEIGMQHLVRFTIPH